MALKKGTAMSEPTPNPPAPQGEPEYHGSSIFQKNAEREEAENSAINSPPSAPKVEQQVPQAMPYQTPPIPHEVFELVKQIRHVEPWSDHHKVSFEEAAALIVAERERYAAELHAILIANSDKAARLAQDFRNIAFAREAERDQLRRELEEAKIAEQFADAATELIRAKYDKMVETVAPLEQQLAALQRENAELKEKINWYQNMTLS